MRMGKEKGGKEEGRCAYRLLSILGWRLGILLWRVWDRILFCCMVVTRRLPGYLMYLVVEYQSSYELSIRVLLR